MKKTQTLYYALIGCCLITFSQFAVAIDMENGQEINEVCAGCHGEFGQGSDSEYPRLAGQPIAYIVKQLELFKARKRPNIAMIEYIDERQMPAPDIADVSAFLQQIVLKTKLPPANENDPGFDAYARLIASKKLTQIPLVEGNINTGQKRYKKECASCHGKTGEGDQKKAVPMLSGQYTDYLWRQVTKYRKGIRIHDEDEPDDELLKDFTDAELQDIFAYLSIVDD